MKLLNIDKNTKTVKGQSKGYMTAIMYLAPYNLSGYQVCPMATKACSEACLNTAGRGIFSNVQKARIKKTKLYFENRGAFMWQLMDEISKFVKHAEKKGFTPVVRLNGTSDIPWERVPVEGVTNHWGAHPNIMGCFPDIQFYDYTKQYKRMKAYLTKAMPANYHLTFSLAEDNDAAAAATLLMGGTVAVVFKNMPTRFLIAEHSAPVVSGDETDLRFLDEPGHIVALKAKGKARKDVSGFVR